MNEASRHPSALQLTARLTGLLCCVVLLINSVVLLLKLLFNIGAFYRAEQLAWKTLLAGFAEPSSAALAPIILAAWPIVICVLCFVVTIAGATIFIMYDPINALKRRVAVLEALCPDFPGGSTLGWSAWLDCRAELNTARAALYSICAIFAVAALVTLINILVLA